MRISVVIPVYNAEKYLPYAITSVLAQEDLLELILVEDASPDRCLDICEEFASRDTRIRVLRHPDGMNHGTAASFNLGIRSATAPYIAFLGADDQYVEGGLRKLIGLMDELPDADAVYGHLGVTYHDPELKARHLERIPREVTGMDGFVAPEDLLCQLLKGGRGHLSLDSILVRREILTGAYMFDESLRQGQDTDLILRLAGRYRLYGTTSRCLVALRGVHRGNRVFNLPEAQYYQDRFLLKCILHNFYGCSDRKVAEIVIYRYLRPRVNKLSRILPGPVVRRVLYRLFLLRYPGVAAYLRSLD